MIIFPYQALPLVDSLMIELVKSCEKIDCVLHGAKWAFSQDAREALTTLLSLPCVCGEHSISSLADEINAYNFDFSDS